jgi:hypothetical protein
LVAEEQPRQLNRLNLLESGDQLLLPVVVEIRRPYPTANHKN